MKVVIQCAARKNAGAGYLTDLGGRPVLFVANPMCAPRSDMYRYARPDDLADAGRTWRDEVIEYNNRRGSNRLNLAPAHRLYAHPVYGELVDQYGVDSVYILSAGWGLIRADFLTPQYDITFSHMTEKGGKYKQRRTRDPYQDMSMLPRDTADHLVFFGGKSYLPLFCTLSRPYLGTRFVFYNSKVQPQAPGCTFVRYETTIKTNWHYACARDFMAGRIGV